MEIFEFWQEQREGLAKSLEAQEDLASAVVQVRKALAQTEQNAFAAMKDDVLRQQAGVLMSCVKNAVSLAEVQVVSQSWVAAEVKPEQKPRLHRTQLAALMAEALVLILAVYDGNLISSGICAAGLAFTLLSFFRKEEAPRGLPKDEVKVTVRPDTQKLLSELDQQLRAVDCYLNDFAYLNEQLATGYDGTDAMTIQKAAGLMEAVSECEGEGREAVYEASVRLLEGLGLSVMDYGEETKGYFNLLPSKRTTKTMMPAILSLKDGHLLKRGTAVVAMEG